MSQFLQVKQNIVTKIFCWNFYLLTFLMFYSNSILAQSESNKFIEGLLKAKNNAEYGYFYTLFTKKFSDSSTKAEQIIVFITALENQDKMVRRNAFRTLLNLEEKLLKANLKVPMTEKTLRKRSVSLKKALDDPDKEVRLYSAFLLLRLGEELKKAFPIAIKGFKNNKAEIKNYAKSSVLAIQGQVDKILPEIEKAFKEMEPELRTEIIFYLSMDLKNKEQSALILMRLSSKALDAELRKNASQSLVHLIYKQKTIMYEEKQKMYEKPPQFIKDLIPQLIQILSSDPEEKVREYAMSALYAIRGTKGCPQEGIPTMIKVLNDSSEDIRETALTMLGCVGKKAVDAIPVLITFTNDKNDMVRSRTAWVLGKIAQKPEETIPALVKFLDDQNLEVKKTAIWAIGKFGKQADIAIPALLKALEDKRITILNKVVTTLPKIGPKASITVPNLIALLKTTKAKSLKKNIIKAFEKIGTQETLPILQEMVKDPDDKIASLAEKVIKKSSTKK